MDMQNFKVWETSLSTSASRFIMRGFDDVQFADAIINDGEASEAPIPVILPLNQLSIFVHHYDTGQSLERLPLYAYAELGIVSRTLQPDDGGDAPFPSLNVLHSVKVPLGLLGTDHVGYASFDLTILRNITDVQQLLKSATQAGVILNAQVRDELNPFITLTGIWVFPFCDPIMKVDCLKDGDVATDFVVLRLELNETDLSERVFDRPMASLQNPNILDWRMSPGSFSLSSSLLVGEDGCETLLPANLATQQFRFRQVVRSNRVNSSDNKQKYRFGHVLEYTTEWFSVGHSLGQILYSLPLAPGEKIKIAIIDWSRSDAASRTEDTKLNERLLHEQLRDRSLSESVRALLQEWQEGSTFMGGVGQSVGGGGNIGVVSVGVGQTMSLGGGSSSSSGTRDLSADTVQRISDSFHQASTAVRELRSTVVVQAEQSETNQLKTRVIANYNHSHALTILYYEVLRHYRVVTRLASTRLALLVDYSQRKFKFEDISFLISRRRVLQPNLLDPSLAGLFDALVRIKTAQAKLSVEKAKWDLLPTPSGRCLFSSSLK
jgi:hypothetical protein